MKLQNGGFGMTKFVWAVIALVAAGVLGAWGFVGASARNCSAYNAQPVAAATATAAPVETAAPVPAEYHKLTAEEAKARMDSGDPVVIVDVRTPEEFEGGHISGAINVPNEGILDEMPEALPDPNAEILVYCRSGRRSSDAAHKLLAMGYTAVYDFGGIIDWPYETVK
jgi:rhodanese-related sulfurtransferase